jgi:small subunit ribosomal protein S5
MSDEKIITSQSTDTLSVDQNRPRFKRPERNNKSRFNDAKSPFAKKKPRTDKRTRDEDSDSFETQVLQVRRVTRVVKGGKRMRFSALVVVGDKSGKVGYGLEKGLDYQESVSKATRKAKENILNINITKDGSLKFPIISEYKSSTIMLKPAYAGTGLISGGFIRPVLELVGVKNIYTKVLGTNNKITGVKAMFKALQNYSK